LNCPGRPIVQQLINGIGKEFPVNSPEVQAMRECLLMTWDKADQIELVVNDAMVNRPRGSGPSARNSLPSILWYKDIAKAIVARFGHGKAYETLKEMAENIGIKFYELQRLCYTRIAQSERKVYVNFMRYWSFILPALEELVKGAKAERRATYEAWLGKTKDFHWVANVITLADLLGLCMNVSLKMQTVNILQWELLETEGEFVKASGSIQAELRAKRGFPPKYFHSFMQSLKLLAQAMGLFNTHALTI
jgi:hypothetical protein